MILTLKFLGKPNSLRSLFVRFGSKKDVGILEKAMKVEKWLKNTVLCMVPRLREPRIIVFDVPNNVKGVDVIDAAMQ